MSSPIIQPSAFNVSKVSISQPKVLDSGAKMAYLNYGEKSNLIMQTPSLPSPFGLSVFDKAGPPKYSLDLALRGYQDDPKVKSLFTALSALDEHMIDLGVKNSKLWFKADMKREIVAAFYTPVVKFGKDKDGNTTPYPPNIKLQLKRNREGTDFDCKFYDHKSKGNANAQAIKDVPLEDMLVKKVEVTALMQCTGVWFAGGKFGVSWKAVQMRLDSVPAGIAGYGFDDVQDEEFAEPEFTGKAIVDDEDKDEDEEDEEMEAPPVPKKVATTVTKKKVVAAVKK
jgi:hypothetical protein